MTELTEPGTTQAHIVGDVEYREGDGPNMRIRKGPCEVRATVLDVTISWADDDSRGVAAMPLVDFKRFVAQKRIRLEEPLAPPDPPAPEASPQG